jgi:hypothetical protein
MNSKKQKPSHTDWAKPLIFLVLMRGVEPPTY